MGRRPPLFCFYRPEVADGRPCCCLWVEQRFSAAITLPIRTGHGIARLLVGDNNQPGVLLLPVHALHRLPQKRPAVRLTRVDGVGTQNIKQVRGLFSGSARGSRKRQTYVRPGQSMANLFSTMLSAGIYSFRFPKSQKAALLKNVIGLIPLTG